MEVKGDLSFVVNGGFGWTGPPCGVISPSNYTPIDLNGSGLCTVNPKDGEPSDVELMFRTGLFFAENWPQAQEGIKRHNLGSIRDGASQTIMMTENIHAGHDPNGDHGNWANPNSWRTCFFISGHVCKDLQCKAGTVDFTRANDRTQAPYQFEAINSSFQIEGAAPWPTSYHAGGVNVAFCDGSVRFISENLDGRTYVALMTPAGSMIEGPLAQSPLATDGF
ncbi:MAG: putative major pilin subunit [Planctomycetaceae bacterium]|nr:putative major pilin subunit [Planctomycetaceae bacterium]